jgi:death-on-curing protein
MIEITWLNRADCLAVHEMLLAQFGGLNGIRDENMLESALGKPRHLLAYSDPDITDLAASYAIGIIKNHPFVDGNKRTGFILATQFLEANGMEFTATEVDAALQTLALAAGEIDEAAYAKWLKKNSRKP